jgi:hypothetical protein
VSSLYYMYMKCLKRRKEFRLVIFAPSLLISRGHRIRRLFFYFDNIIFPATGVAGVWCSIFYIFYLSNWQLWTIKQTIYTTETCGRYLFVRRCASSRYDHHICVVLSAYYFFSTPPPMLLHCIDARFFWKLHIICYVPTKIYFISCIFK